MKSPIIAFVTVLLYASWAVAAAPTHKLDTVNEVPQGLAKEIATQLNPQGWQIVGPEGPLSTFWLLKKIPVKPGFQPTFSVVYPFTPGQLIGALRVKQGAKFTDFRGQELPPGMYTVRYGQQPQDGNHIGTSDIADFLLALPAKVDTQAGKIDTADKLHQISAKSAGSTHPAIFSMLPNDEPVKSAQLSHNADHEFWILSLPGRGNADGKAVKVGLQFVVIGQALE